MTSLTPHAAVGPSLGYSYQAIYALKLLLQQPNPNSQISVESWDDVVLVQGSARELHQLKHSINANTTIGVKSAAVWRTLTVWLDYSDQHGVQDSLYFLTTVATLQPGSALECLRTPGSSRVALAAELMDEASRVLEERKQAENNKVPKEKWPHADRHKDCARYLDGSATDRLRLLDRTSLLPGSFQIKYATEEIKKILTSTCPSAILGILAKQVISWWDREVLETLTRERTSPLSAEEVRLFITKRAAELLNQNFFDDTETHVNALTPTASDVLRQLEFIEATQIQCNRSITMELRARAQRAAWMEADISKAPAIEKYDSILVQEWSYESDPLFDSKKNTTDQEKKIAGRQLLEWAFNSYKHVRRIEERYSNPDYIRGSYIYLSGEKKLGWHPDYKALLDIAKKNSK